SPKPRPSWPTPPSPPVFQRRSRSTPRSTAGARSTRPSTTRPKPSARGRPCWTASSRSFDPPTRRAWARPPENRRAATPPRARPSGTRAALLLDVPGQPGYDEIEGKLDIHPGRPVDALHHHRAAHERGEPHDHCQSHRMRGRKTGGHPTTDGRLPEVRDDDDDERGGREGVEVGLKSRDVGVVEIRRRRVQHARVEGEIGRAHV